MSGPRGPSGDEVVRLFARFLASNRGAADVGIDAVGLTSEPGALRVRLSFRAGRDYCCQEPGCHVGLVTAKAWSRLHALAVEDGLELAGSFSVRVHVVTEAGATFANLRALGVSDVAEAATFEHLFSRGLPRYRGNVEGDFYVASDCCTLCGVPALEAPDLFAEDESQCFVRRQPDSPVELERMVRAIRLADLRCVRYGGDEPAIVTALEAVGEIRVVDRAVVTLYQVLDAAEADQVRASGNTRLPATRQGVELLDEQSAAVDRARAAMPAGQPTWIASFLVRRDMLASLARVGGAYRLSPEELAQLDEAVLDGIQLRRL